MPKIAVIGAGKWGANIVRTCHELGVLQLVSDLSTERLADTRRLFPGIVTTPDVDGVMRSDAAAIAIATSAPSHSELALLALENGKDVFVEKPLALNVADAQAVVRAAERCGRKVFVGHLLLYHPAIVALRAIVDDGKIGSIVHLRSRRLGPGRIRTNENVWWSFAPHDVAVMLEVLGEPETVTASELASIQPGIADFTYADFGYAGGRSAHIEVSWLDPEKSSRIDIFGTRGVVSVETARAQASLTHRTLTTAAAAAGIIPVDFRDGETQQFASADPLRTELRAFVDWISGGVTPPTDGHAGLRVVRTLAATHDALRTVDRFRVEGERLAALL